MSAGVTWNPPAPPMASDGHPRRAARGWRIPNVTLLRIDRWDARRDGPLSEGALRRKIESGGYKVSRRSWPAGAAAAGEPQGRVSANGVASGLLKVTVDGESAILAPGDILFVPRGAVRRVEVVGSAPVSALEGVAA